MTHPEITQIAEHAYFVESRAVNWTILTDGDALTLIDTGYPGDLRNVEASVRQIGHRLDQITAILITHAHIDHIGSLPRLLTHAPDARVLTSDVEARHAHREFFEQATPRDVIANIWRPGFLPWSLSVVRIGATKHVSVPQAEPFPAPGPLDVPGGPVPIPTPGHTSGHCCYHLPGIGAIVTGDTLVTAHPTSPVHGPQTLLPVFNHDQAGTVAALDILQDIDADLILPGHGPLHRGALHEATKAARATA
jgi:glyoxylase-like metal-dependent hydrolase (beta-lactamase superfamily II)